VVAPFWFAFVGTVVILLFTWRSIAYVTHEAQVTSSGLDDVGQSHV
jgi:hypothetical protein